MKHVLTIAGTDPSGAAGIQVDLQVFRDFGHHGLSCITAVITQNTSGVQDWVAVEPRLVASQLDSIFNDIRVDAVKIGMVPTAASAEAIAEALRGRRLPIVVDPVLASGSGKTALVREGTTEALMRHVFPLATLVTPNFLEARVLTSHAAAEDVDLDTIARELHDTTGVAILTKAGHAPGTGALVDVLVSSEGIQQLAPHPRIDADVRGTGCQLSSAIASELATGTELVAAIEAARAYLASHLQERRARIGKGRPVILRTPTE
jgi:hydroxymethylpyrimidine/phosphomethylpyrimidine kinase